MHLLSCCCVVQVGECVLNELGIVVVVLVAVVVVVGCTLIYTMEFISYSYASLGAHALECYHSTIEGLCPGMLVIHPLRAYALGCFNHPIVEGSCPGMLVIQRA